MPTHVGGKIYGVPVQLSQVALFYDKPLLQKGGVDPASIKTWDDFLAAVKKLKAAGVTPIVMGGGEKWPMHFFWSYLLMRTGGSEVLSDAEAGKNGGFKGAAFVEAGKRPEGALRPAALPGRLAEHALSGLDRHVRRRQGRL